MGRKGDYGITRVRYDGDGDMVEQVEVMREFDQAFVGGEVWGRDKVIVAIVMGKRLCTIGSGLRGAWRPIAEVGIVKVNGLPYLRVDGICSNEDDLGKRTVLRRKR